MLALRVERPECQGPRVWGIFFLTLNETPMWVWVWLAREV